jgi:hypothetical protein
MAVMDRKTGGAPQKYFELVLTGYGGVKTRSAAIVILGHFCGIKDAYAATCFDGLPEFKEVLITSKEKASLIQKGETLKFYGFTTEIREEVQ